MGDAQRLGVDWTQQQWGAIDAAVASEVKRVRVVEQVIPTTKVGANDKTVAIDRIDALTRTIDDVTTIPLPEISVQFFLDKQQVQQPELTRALSLARRAASDFARIEDEVLLRGLAVVANGYRPDGRALPRRADIQRGQDRANYDGLAGSARNVAYGPRRRPHQLVNATGGGFGYGPLIVSAVAEAIVILEAAGHMGPYHLILGRDAFIAALTPNAPALVLPKDQIEPLLASPIRRSPALDAEEGVLVSVGGDPADRVVAVEPTLRFIETTAQDRYRFRLYGVLAMRRKEPEAAVRLLFPP
ncbi:encapsulin [Bradyrhizobium icense]|uniref:Bacteriocin n=1 Tax=Bradyrhizobium icense TaxID=1274631 RepID=A0A1B1UCX4_9BRAD|nr:encapsulin [Bradyrhizobium icense]ANW00605.1 hypothetical protein LMTR13_10940 [Bradyrhizobium icense]